MLASCGVSSRWVYTLILADTDRSSQAVQPEVTEKQSNLSKSPQRLLGRRETEEFKVKEPFVSSPLAPVPPFEWCARFSIQCEAARRTICVTTVRCFCPGKGPMKVKMTLYNRKMALCFYCCIKDHLYLTTVLTFLVPRSKLHQLQMEIVLALKVNILFFSCHYSINNIVQQLFIWHLHLIRWLKVI